MLVCDKCEGKIPDEAKFCPHCGDPVTSADKAETAVASSSEAIVEISFGYSASARFEQAVSICKNIPTHETSGEGKNEQHRVKLPISEIELLINLWEQVGSWKSARMLINGQPATKSNLVYKGAGCFRSRLKAYNREQYCFGEQEYEFNIWGCKRLEMPINEWAEWLQYGELDKQGVWHFDKARIQHELEVKIHENELCPILNNQRVLETLNRLPDTIDPKTDKYWNYRTSYEEVRGEYRDVAVGIKPVLKKASRFVLGNYQPEWKAEERDEVSDHSRTIQIEIEAPKVNRSRSNKTGCLTYVILGIAIATILVLLAF